MDRGDSTVCVRACVCACSFVLTCDIEPHLPMHLCHDDAHHVGDRLRFHDSKCKVGLIKCNWVS